MNKFKKSFDNFFIKNKSNNSLLFYISIILIILLIFIFKTPKILPKVFRQYDQNLVNKFINTTIKNQKIDPQDFWMMREYYCPDSFIFKHDSNPFLTFSCQKLVSQDSFTSSSLLETKSKQLTDKIIIYQNPSILIRKNNSQLEISFVLTIDEMKKANGFFDYKTRDQKLMENKFWLNKTTINL